MNEQYSHLEGQNGTPTYTFSASGPCLARTMSSFLAVSIALFALSSRTKYLDVSSLALLSSRATIVGLIPVRLPQGKLFPVICDKSSYSCLFTSLFEGIPSSFMFLSTDKSRYLKSSEFVTNDVTKRSPT